MGLDLTAAMAAAAGRELMTASATAGAVRKHLQPVMGRGPGGCCSRGVTICD